MAARRLIVVMLVLLGISTAIAILAPDPAQRTAESGGTEQPADPGPEATAGPSGTSGPKGVTGESAPGTQGKGAGKSAEKAGSDTISAVVALGRNDQPETICIRPGSRLVLTVRTDFPVDVSLPSFGRVSPATQFAPAVFDLLLPDESGSYKVETLEGGRRIATILGTWQCQRLR